MSEAQAALNTFKEIAGLGAGAMIATVVIAMFLYLRTQSKAAARQSDLMEKLFGALATAQNNKDDIENLNEDNKTRLKILQDMATLIPTSNQVISDLHQLVVAFIGKQEAVHSIGQQTNEAIDALARDQEAGLNSLGVKMNEIQTDVHDGNAEVIAELRQIKETLRDMVNMLKPALESLEHTAERITSEQPAVAPGDTIETKQSESEDK